MAEQTNEADQQDQSQATASDDSNQLKSLVKQLQASNEALQISVGKLESNNQSLMKEKIEKAKQAEVAKLEAAKAGGQSEDLNKAWQEKYDNSLAEFSNKEQGLNSIIKNLTVNSEARKIAHEIALTPENAELIELHIKNRLSVDITDNSPLIRVLDSNGKVSAQTTQELKEEFRTRPGWENIMVGSKANGGGNVSDSGGRGPAQKLTVEAFNMLSPAEQKSFADNKGEII